MKYTGTDVLMNKVIACQYNGKDRNGKVVKTSPTVITIELPEGGYRSMTIAKIVGLEVK